MNLKLFLRKFKKNHARVCNDYGERIESLRFTVPALHVGVLEYAPGELTTKNKKLDGKVIKLYYPPESLKDVNFLKSLETAPVTVGGHDSTTNEHNKKIDGWSHTVLFDPDKQAAMISGVVKGNKEIAYIKGNLKQKDFGASALIDFVIDEKSGITPDGKEYNAIAKELRAGHVTLAQHVRDPQNKIKVTNSVVVNTDGNYTGEQNKMAEMTAEQIDAIVKNAVSEALAARNAEEEIKRLRETVKNLEEEKEKMEEEKKEEKKEAENGCGKSKNEAYEGKETPEEEAAEEKLKESEAENAKPSQSLVAAFATAFNIDFGGKTPSFSTLAALSGITEKDPFLRITAVNAKFAEISTASSAKNSSELSYKEVL